MSLSLDDIKEMQLPERIFVFGEEPTGRREG